MCRSPASEKHAKQTSLCRCRSRGDSGAFLVLFLAHFSLVSACCAHVVRVLCCSPTGERLADALSSFSFDAIAIVAGYLVNLTAYNKAIPHYVFSFGERIMGNAWGLCVGPKETVWVAYSQLVRVYNTDGVYLFDACEKQVSAPKAIACDTAANEVFIVDKDAERACVLVCAADGKFLRKFGSRLAPFHFNDPMAIAIDSQQGLVYVADRAQNRVIVCTRTGDYIRGFGDGTLTHSLKAPIGLGVCASDKDKVYVCDAGTAALGRIQVCFFVSLFLGLSFCPCLFVFVVLFSDSLCACRRSTARASFIRSSVTMA